jgi:carbon monoxide dehydrogenase subunit G
MKITNEFVVQVPIDRAWQVLTDLEGIAPCMPGAQLTGVEGEVYKGKVKVKVGPVISEFAGTAQFTEKDDAAYRAIIDAKGRDARSAGNAAAVVSASLTAEGPSATKVSVDTDLKISGKLAQFGSGMIKEVSSKLLTQFVANLEKKLATEQTAPGAVPAADSAAAETPATASASAEAPAASAVAPESVSAPVAPVGTASAAAVATAPDTAVALGDVEPAASAAADDTASTAVAPDPSAGEVEPAAGRIETAKGTPEPVAPLRVPAADLTAAAGPAGAGAATGTGPAAGNGAAGADAVAAPGTGARTTERVIRSEEPEALDLLAVAGGSIYKRVVPVAVGAAVVAAAVIVWFVARG